MRLGSRMRSLTHVSEEHTGCIVSAHGGILHDAAAQHSVTPIECYTARDFQVHNQARMLFTTLGAQPGRSRRMGPGPPASCCVGSTARCGGRGGA